MDSATMVSSASSARSLHRSIGGRDDTMSLTSFGNPFDEDQDENTSYAIVSSLLSKVKNTFVAQSTPASSNQGYNTAANHGSTEQTRNAPTNRPPILRAQNLRERPNSFSSARPRPAPPLVSMTPVISEVPTYIPESAMTPSRTGELYQPSPDPEAIFSTSIPGFPIQDDARSIRTSASVKRTGSASKVIRRLRGDGLSKDYWMDDELCRECYDCKSAFTTWRRKHHCRICGQIYCSRCASNILKGSRFGQDGVVRVCNLCLQMLEDESYDDDDDRRSVTSTTSSPFPAHQLESVQSAYPQNPFAASQIFSQSTHEPFSLFSIPESNLHRVSFGGRISPDDGVWDVDEAAAPFRRGFADDEKDAIPSAPDALDTYISDSSEAPIRPKMPLGRHSPALPFPTFALDHLQSESSIHFPGSSSSPEGAESPRPLRSRVSSFATDVDALAPPFLRSRVQSRLAPEIGEPGWRTRRESSAYAAELNGVSMFHLRIMLRQLLTKENIPHIKEWEETLLKLSLRVASHLSHNPHAPGGSMDVRKYIKIKKIPGGAPRDSEYVDGAVITKNVAHKNMVRDIRNPRIMLVTFPFDYHRVEGQFMSFDPLLAQEKDYLFNLVSRVAALRPHIVLVERSVSRLALEYLLKANIAVARTVKPSALQFVGRATQAQVIASMDRLALEPHMGQCSRFRIQTFEHALIPGRRKTYMRFEGCSHDSACTIILRGEDLETLKRIKAVTSFMMFIVRNLKMETFVWKDTVITMPTVTADAAPARFYGRQGSITASPASITTQLPESSRASTSTTSTTVSSVTDVFDSEYQPSGHEPSISDRTKSELSQRIQQSIEPYLTTFISASATLRFPPPYPIWRMKELDDQLAVLQQDWEDEEAASILREERGHLRDVTVTLNSAFDSDAASSIGQDMPTTPRPGDSAPMAIERKVRHTASQSSFMSLRSSNASSLGQARSLPGPDLTQAAPIALRDVSEVERESVLSRARFEHEEQQRVWEWYLRKNSDDFVVQKYQCIYVRQSTIPTLGLELEVTCFMPQLKRITYYGENDCTLGQFIEDAVAEGQDPKNICGGKGCKKPVGAHTKVYVHNESRVLVAVEPWRGKSDNSSAPGLDKIATFSLCRVCLQTTPFIPISEEALKYSFGKFLELHFYPAEVHLLHGAGCEHNIYLHHIRYFVRHGMTVRFQTDAIDLFEVVFPPMRTRVRMESLLELKNRDYEHLLLRTASYWQSVVSRVVQIQGQCKPEYFSEKSGGNVVSAATQLLQRADVDRAEIMRSIHNIYKESAPTDTLALGSVRSSIQNKVVQWDLEVDQLEKTFMPNKTRMLSEKDLRRMTGSHHFKRIYDDFFGHYASSVSEIDEKSYDHQEDSARAPPSGSESAPESTGPPSSSEAPAATSSSDADSDSTISAPRTQRPQPQPEPEAEAEVEVDIPNPSTTVPESALETAELLESARPPEDTASPETAPFPESKNPTPYLSKLPRWSGPNPTVADLVKQFQSLLPDDMGFSTPMAETQPAIEAPGSESQSNADEEAPPKPRIRLKSNASKNRSAARHSLASDFERSYAANIAPRHLTHTRRPLGSGPATSRIPAPVKQPLIDSQPSTTPATPARRKSPPRRGSNFSPQKRGPGIPLPRVHHVGAGSDRNDKRIPSGSTSKISKGKGVQRTPLRTATNSRLPAQPKPLNSRRITSPNIGTSTNTVSNITKQFERMSKDTERANRRYAVMRGRRARPVATARAKVEVFDNIRDAVMDESDDESSDSSSEADDEDDGDEDSIQKQPLPHTDDIATQAESSPSTAPISPNSSAEQLPEASGSVAEPTPIPQTPMSMDESIPDGSASTSSTPMTPPDERAIEEYFPAMYPELAQSITLGGGENSTVMGTVSGWWRSHNNAVQLQYPFTTAEHVFSENSIAVREDEPTSIIAFTLNSRDHKSAMYKAKTERHTQTPERSPSMPDDTGISPSAWSVINKEDVPDPAELLKHPGTVTHLSFQFESGGVAISCTVFCAEQFEALRRSCDCESTMVESLARCLKWDATGGKSGSAFLKTRDDRFIAKELSKNELDAMTKFAPAYFDYMSNAITSNRPTLLAKIFGFYKIAYKNPMLGKTVRMNLMVMENLFYGRRFSRIYDLKGSMRNRHVQSTGRENEVLLDENLVQSSHLSPFYLREHAKRILRGALWNDSKFLADLNVMDYSVLVAVDSVKNELVVGIVDFIRTYTWDKKVESWVKDSAFLGGGAKGEPTIVTPKQYKARFRSAMERYFPLVPDRWMKQQDAPDDEGDSLLEMWPDW